MPQRYKKYNTIEQDGRIKIPKSSYKEVRKKYKELKSQRAAARYYNVSRRLIVFILNPDKYKNQLRKRRKNKVHLLCYDREKQKIAMRKYRAKKRRLGFAYSIKNSIKKR